MFARGVRAARRSLEASGASRTLADLKGHVLFCRCFSVYWATLVGVLGGKTLETLARGLFGGLFDPRGSLWFLWSDL